MNSFKIWKYPISETILKAWHDKKNGKDMFYSLWKLETRVIKDQHFVFLLTSYLLNERKIILV